MNDRLILLRLDTERQTIADPDCTLENTTHLVRALGNEGLWNGVVYSRFLPGEPKR